MMYAGLVAQYVVVALAVVFSAAFVARRQFPDSVRRLRVACALPLVREGRPSWLRRIGRWLAPVSTGTGGSCGACNGCDPK
jgi:hypothetical protein